MVLAFPLVEKWLVWKVGNGNFVRLGQDTSVGCKENFCFPRNIVSALRDKGYFYISQIADNENSSIWRKALLSAERLGLIGDDIDNLVTILTVGRHIHSIEGKPCHD